VMKIGNKINFVPGARFEKYTYDMNAWNIKMDMGSDYKVSGEPTHAVRVIARLKSATTKQNILIPHF